MIFLPEISNSQDTLICDNGGFEDGFDYYFGYGSEYYFGGDDCIPLDLNSDPVIWSLLSLPEFRRLEMVSSGLDTLTGISRTKFGSKSVLLNNRYPHTGLQCTGHFGIDKLVKRFKVTEQNRSFTIWYAAVLENPNGHINRQPFFSIKCDKAPSYDLCFDGSKIECETYFLDSLCKDGEKFDSAVVVDWTCHRIIIPHNEIGNIATLEIIAADCGESAHFGYAYIDGICEECEGSSFGSATIYNHPIDENGLGIEFDQCSDTIAVCGTFTIPTICGDWILDSVLAFGNQVYNLVIDTPNLKFCLKLPRDLFLSNCLDFYLQFFFNSNNTIPPPVISNSIYICPEDYADYDVDVITGICQDNNTSDLISDDYYYVQVQLDHLKGDTFTILRHIDDPYPNETGKYVIKADTGDGIFNLGPFYIQEGSWDLIIKFEHCSDTIPISPPFFCSGCNKFYRTSISNITCDDEGTISTADDTWSFDIYVHGTTGTYNLSGGGLGSTQLNYNTNYTINVPGTIGQLCKTFLLDDGSGCNSQIIICSPKPCSIESQCELEVYLKEVSCNEEEGEFYIEVDTSNVGTGYLCYKSYAMSEPTTLLYGGSFSNPIGPFTEDVFIVFYVCSTSACDCDLTCFKVVYYPMPDCENLDYRINRTGQNKLSASKELFISSNPINSKELLIKSYLEFTEFEFYNLASKLIYKGSFIGSEYKLTLEIPAGVYIVKYKDQDKKLKHLKVMKL